MKSRMYIWIRYKILSLVIISITIGCQWDLDEIEFIELDILTFEVIENVNLLIEASIQGLSKDKVDQHGFIWSSQTDNPNLRIKEGIIQFGEKENGNYSAIISDLSPGTSYYFKPFATIGEREYYGTGVAIVTGQLSLITGELVYSGGPTASITGSISGISVQLSVVDYGHVWSSTVTNPTLFNSPFSKFGRPGGETLFTSVVKDIENNSPIYIRAYALFNFGQDTLFGKTIQQNIVLTDHWRKLADYPNEFGISATSHFILDGQAYVLLGFYGDYQPDNPVWAYNPIADSWTKKSNFPSGESIGPIAFSFKGYGYAGSISTDEKVIYKYDPQADNWTEQTTFPGAPRRFAQTFVFKDKIFVVGGYGLDYITLINHNDLWQYNPDSNQWIQGEDLPFVFKSGAIGLVINDKGYVFNATGKEDIGIGKNQVWEFDPNTKKWLYIGQFPDDHIESGARFSLNGKGYLIGGFSLGFKYTRIFWGFDPTDKTWLRKADFPGPERSLAFSFSINNKGYMGGGDTHIGRLNDFWEYIPANN